MAASLHPTRERRRWIHEEPLSVVLASSSPVTAIAHVLVCRRWHAAKASSRLHLALDARLPHSSPRPRGSERVWWCSPLHFIPSYIHLPTEM
ncbi:hypothetical protein QYE76_035225 [Lolium multiflorum]|uniref:Uncharacterized protein n=1 Tax=Lolium multiflorum TaxID=4521 RepID=A0AAD8VKZ4_LOLMU|nr:hypothetical protein QYE76_033436 [Lolium multiflorum]KAK1611551.1 hypothetical protein QYE76_035224 [Lolium multiflorum]KAK1611552.1 hypothetical protein QYE76_035225 [Lolium multiflorum]